MTERTSTPPDQRTAGREGCEAIHLASSGFPHNCTFPKGHPGNHRSEWGTRWDDEGRVWLPSKSLAAPSPLPADPRMKEVEEQIQQALSDYADAVVTGVAGRVSMRAFDARSRVLALVQGLVEDARRLDWLEARTIEQEWVALNFTEAWTENGEMGTVLSRGPREFWLRDDGEECGPTLRAAIDAARALQEDST